MKMTNILHDPELKHLVVDSRFVHLATCSLQNIPNIALMHYLYVQNNDINKNDFIILSLGKDTETYQNLIENQKVSLLFHNWIYISPTQLLNTDTSSSSLSSQFSVMIKGSIEIYQQFNKQFKFWRSNLLRSNPDADNFILQDDNVILKVECQYLKVTDINNNIKIYT